MRNVWTIARREYHRFFASPIAYVVAFVMLLTLGIMFSITILYFRQNALGGGYGAPTAPDMSGITGTFAFLLILMLPAITMRLVSDENRMGTMELLLTAPVRDWELIVGKWLGGYLYMLTLMASTLIYAFVLNALVTPGLDQRRIDDVLSGPCSGDCISPRHRRGRVFHVQQSDRGFLCHPGCLRLPLVAGGLPRQLRWRGRQPIQLSGHEDAFL